MRRSSSRSAGVRCLGTALVLLAAACDTGDGRSLEPPTLPLPEPVVTEPSVPPTTSPPLTLELIAPWQDGAAIPVRYTCDGADVAPAMTWTNVPADTVELALTVTDLDAAGFVHWILYAIPPSQTSLLEDDVPDGLLEWQNSFGSTGWAGPCPPPGEVHRYQITLHALNQQLEVADNASATEVISTLNLIAIDQRSVSGTYARTE